MSVTWADIADGYRLPTVTLEITLRRTVLTPAYAHDPFPGHYDPEFARSVGHPTAFMNTIPLLGLLDRVVTDWAGPGTTIGRHTIALRSPGYVGDVLNVEGAVTGWTPDDAAGTAGIETSARIVTADGRLCATGTVSAQLRR